MPRSRSLTLAAGLAALAVGPQLGGCGIVNTGFDPLATGTLPNGKQLAAVTPSDRECLARAMYFESNRSSEDGLLAVGTVVMNRLESPAFPNSICGVVGQPRQFAAGVLRKPMREGEREKAEQVADAVLAGERHEGVRSATHFHTAGLHFSYSNMHYTALAGGNAFYEKRPRRERDDVPIMVAQTYAPPSTQASAPSYRAASPILQASAPARPARVARASGQTPLAELGPARNICRVAAVETARAPG
jgi:spore germination cell wall hydrolase CwlJ-like protein